MHRSMLRRYEQEWLRYESVPLSPLSRLMFPISYTNTGPVDLGKIFNC